MGGETTEPEIPRGPEEIRKLLVRAHEGDKSTLPALRTMLEKPEMVRVLGGELAEQAVHSFADAMAGKNLSFREAVLRKLELLRAELLGESPTPVERLLVERVAACWLQVQDADMRYAQSQGTATIKQGDYGQRRMDSAHRRYLSALKALALVRKLALPALQINVARRQVNVVAPPASG